MNRRTAVRMSPKDAEVPSVRWSRGLDGVEWWVGGFPATSELGFWMLARRWFLRSVP